MQEGTEYSVEIKFKVNNLVSGLKYIQAAKRAGMTGACDPSRPPNHFLDHVKSTNAG